MNIIIGLLIALFLFFLMYNVPSERPVMEQRESAIVGSVADEAIMSGACGVFPQLE